MPSRLVMSTARTGAGPHGRRCRGPLRSNRGGVWRAGSCWARSPDDRPTHQLRVPQLPNPHPVDPLLDDDFGMLAVAEVAAEGADAVLPVHPSAGLPCWGYLGGAGRRHIALVALAGLARLATGGTCSACHRFRLTLERFGFCAFVSVPSMQSKKNVTGTPSAFLTPSTLAA